MTDRYAVMGNPIEHSKSPLIHAEFAKSTGEDIEYGKILVPEDEFEAYVQDFMTQGKGLNITVPFKEKAFQIADELTPRAQRAQAVNTLKKMPNGKLLADNTDGAGLVQDLVTNNTIPLAGKRTLVLGAGGAVRGVLQPILMEQPSEIVIANRTISKAENLAQDFSDLGTIAGCGFDQVAGTFDLIINGTSASLSGDVPPIPSTCIKPGTTCYDMMYSKDKTAFNQWAEQQGASKTLDGLGMLIEQAAEAFYVWRGVRPETQSMLVSMRES